MLENIRIILVETSHSGNIGSAARAMKTMGLSQLYLVSPKGVDEQTFALAAGAEDIVRNATIVANLEQAIADCSLVIGTSARLRHLQSSLIEPRECGVKALQHSVMGTVAIVFGRERVGLTNDELLKCHYHLTIPANPEYSSLNLAMAVQQSSTEFSITQIDNPFPSASELEYFFSHTEKLYQQLGFIQNQAVMQKLRRLYQRAALEKNELNILLGMLSAVEKSLKS